jgi:hypothetical protein
LLPLDCEAVPFFWGRFVLVRQPGPAGASSLATGELVEALRLFGEPDCRNIPAIRIRAIRVAVKSNRRSKIKQESKCLTEQEGKRSCKVSGRFFR